MSTLPPTYYNILVHTSSSLADLVQTKERIEDGLKISELKYYQAFFEQTSSGNDRSSKRDFLTKLSR